MIETSEMTLSEVSETLGVEWWRLCRLAHYLRLDPTAPYLPRGEVREMTRLATAEERFGAIRAWLLDHA